MSSTPSSTNKPPPQPHHPHPLRATYTNAAQTSQPFEFSTPLPPIEPASTASKIAYLSTLRGAVSALQENINRELTLRMEEDKARDAEGKEEEKDGEKNGRSGKGRGKGGAGKAKAEVDEEKEEELYGEEVVEEDD